MNLCSRVVNHKGYFLVKSWREMFVIKYFGIQKIFRQIKNSKIDKILKIDKRYKERKIHIKDNKIDKILKIDKRYKER